MNIQGYQKLTLLDFPGKVACTVFTGGCNFKCPFCHNASLVLSPTAFKSAQEDIFIYLANRRGIIDGVCITGGEPLLQPDIEDFIKKVKELGLLVKLDTNGSFPKKLKDLIDKNLLDYVAMDIKSSKENYSKLCGVEINIEDIKESIEIIRDSDIPYEFRTTAVKELHTKEDFYNIGLWLKGAKQYFIQGFVDSGNLIMNGLSGFSHAEMQELLKETQKNIPEAMLRGLD